MAYFNNSKELHEKLGRNILVPQLAEPKINNRFIVTFPETVNLESEDKNFKIESWLVNSINKPKLTMGEINYKETIRGHMPRYHWDDIEVTFMSIIEPSTSQYFNNLAESLIKKSIEGIVSTPIPYFFIDTLDPTGVTIEKWKVIVEYIVSIDFGKFDLADDKIQEIKVVFRPSKCVNLY